MEYHLLEDQVIHMGFFVWIYRISQWIFFSHMMDAGNAFANILACLLSIA